MPANVRCNVEDHRLLDGGIKCEDVTKIGLPTLEHPTTSVKSAGMVMDVDLPNMYHYNAMELTIAHNNGTNCQRLANPGIHEIEGRVARENYVTAQGVMDLELVKTYIKCSHKSSEKGDIENGNPYGTTEHYSILRYVEEWNGEKWTEIDAMAGKIKINGVDYSSKLSSLLD